MQAVGLAVGLRSAGGRSSLPLFAAADAHGAAAAEMPRGTAGRSIARVIAASVPRPRTAGAGAAQRDEFEKFKIERCGSGGGGGGVGRITPRARTTSRASRLRFPLCGAIVV